MLSSHIIRTAARIVLVSYFTQFIAPVVYAAETVSESKSNWQNFQMNLKEKIDLKEPFARVAAHKLLPTLSIHMIQQENGTYHFSMNQTHVDIQTNVSMTDFQWETSVNPASPFKFEHPWQQYVQLSFSRGTLFTKSIPQNNAEGFGLYNYVFNVCTNLTLSRLMTNSGFIDVQDSGLLTTRYVGAGAGIRLVSHEKITHTPYKVDAKNPATILSTKQIILQTPVMEVINGYIQGSEILGWFGLTGQQETCLNLSHGSMNAAALMEIFGTTGILNDQGIIKSKTSDTTIHADSMKNKNDAKVQGMNLEIVINQILKTDKTSHLAAKEVTKLTAGTLVHESPFTSKTVFINTATALTLSGPQSLKNLHLRATGQQDVDYSQICVTGLLHLTFPEEQTTLQTSFKTAGKLLLDRIGNSTQPLHILNDLIAFKGVKINIPQAELIIGAEEETQPMVKIQAKDGLLDLNSHSLDIVKAQLFARLGINFEVQEKQIHIGRGVLENVLQTYTYRNFSAPCSTSSGRGFFSFIVSGQKFVVGGGWSTLPTPFSLSASFPFKQPNGTFVVTEGPLSMITPQGILLDQAHLEVRGSSNWDVMTQNPVINNGGKILINGNVGVYGPDKKVNPGATLHNLLPNMTNTLPTISGDTLIANGFAGLQFKHPYSNRGEITIGGNLATSLFENIGGFAYIAGSVSPECHLIGKDFAPTIEPDCELSRALNPFIEEKFSSNVTIAGGAVLNSPIGDLILEGVIQSSLLLIAHGDKLQIGKIANYQRQPTSNFQQLKMITDGMRLSPCFKDVLNSSKPWIRQPMIPLSFKMTLPPAIVIIPEGGLRLMRPREKFLLHPLEEIDSLPSMFESQVKRGCLDWENTDTLKTYILGRQQAYDLYQKFFAPKVTEDAVLDNEVLQNINDSKSTAPTVSNQSKTLSVMTNHLSAEEKAKLKFMVLYCGVHYEGQHVYSPVSWVASIYDDARMRNPDGGIFADELILQGFTKNAELLNFSTIYGKYLVDIDEPFLLNSRTSCNWIEYRVNEYHKKGRWFSSDKHNYEVTAIQCSRSQTNTGIIATGPDGQLNLKAKVFNNKNGAEVITGSGGQNLLIGQLNSTPAIDWNVIRSEGNAKGTHVVQHGSSPTFHPARFISSGGIEGEIDTLNASGTEFIAYEKDIFLQLLEGRLDAPVAHKFLGISVTKEGKAVTVETQNTQTAMPCGFVAFQGDVKLHIKRKLSGVAPTFYGNLILLDGDVDIESLLLATTINRQSIMDGLFSTKTETSMQQSPVAIRAIFEGREVIFRGGKARLGGAFIKAAVRVSDQTETGLILDPTVGKMYYHHVVEVSQPLAHSEVGTEGWQEVMIPTTLDTPLIERKSPDGQMIFTNMEIDKRRTQIIGAFKEELHQLKSWQNSWCIQSQVIPTEAMVVIAIAVTVLTKGMGSSIVSGMMGTTATAGTTASTAMTLSATQIAMANVAFTGLCTKAATSIASTGDPIACVKEILSTEHLRNWAISVGSAGLAEKVGGFYEVNMAPGKKVFIEHLQEHAIRNGASIAVNTIVYQNLNSTIVANTVANTVIDSVAARAANNRSDMPKETIVESTLHKVGHGIDGFAVGYVAGLVSGEDPVKKGLARGFGAAVSETIVDVLTPAGETNPIILERNADISRIMTTGFGTALGLDGNTVFQGADCSLSNNHMTSADNIEDEDEEEKKTKSLIHYVYGDADDVDSVNPKATEMFKGQKVPKESELPDQECRAAPFATNRNRLQRLPMTDFMANEEVGFFHGLSSKAHERTFKNLWTMCVRDWKDGMTYYANLDYPMYVSVISSVAGGGFTVAHIAHSGASSAFTYLGTSIISAAVALELKHISHHPVGINDATINTIQSIYGEKIIVNIAKLAVKGIKSIWREINPWIPAMITISHPSQKIWNFIVDTGEGVLSGTKYLGQMSKQLVTRVNTRISQFLTPAPRNLCHLEGPTRGCSSRPLTIQDFGQNVGSIEVALGRVSLVNNEAVTIYVDYIQAQGLKPRNLITNLIRTAEDTGVKFLTVEGKIINPSLKRYLKKHHGLVEGAHEYDVSRFTIPIKPASWKKLEM